MSTTTTSPTNNDNNSNLTSPRRKVAAAHKTSIALCRNFTLCGECEAVRANFECLQCHERYCASCCISVHHRGRRERHSKFIQLPACGECDALYADVRCEKCEEYYCAECAVSSHSKGNRALNGHQHPFADVTGGITCDPPHRNGTGVGANNSFGVNVDLIRLDTHPDASGDVGPLPPSALTPAATSRQRINVVDGYGSLVDATRAAADALEAMEAWKLKVPRTDETLVIVEGEQAPTAEAAATTSPDDDIAAHPFTSAVLPLTITPVPVRVPRAVQQGADKSAIEKSHASLRKAQETAEAAKKKLEPILGEFRTWRRRADGSEAAATRPVLFAEYRDPLLHRPPLVPVSASLQAHLTAQTATANAAGNNTNNAANDAMSSNAPTADDAALMPFFELSPVHAEFFLMAVAAVLSSNGHGAVRDPDLSGAPSPTSDRVTRAQVEATAAAELRRLQFPEANGDIFRSWFASAERLTSSEMATFRFFVPAGSPWEHRHDESCADTSKWQQQARLGEVGSAQAGDRLRVSNGISSAADAAPSLSAADSAKPVQFKSPAHFVTIDTLLPSLEDRRPAFGRTEASKELWLALLMKAYALAHPDSVGVASLHLDSPAAALEPLTGGATTMATWDPLGGPDAAGAVGIVWWLLQLAAMYHLPCVMTRRPVLKTVDSATARANATAAADDNGAAVVGSASSAQGQKRMVSISDDASSNAGDAEPSTPGGTALPSDPTGNLFSRKPAVDITSDGQVDRSPWLNGDVFVAAAEYRFDAGVAEALLGLDGDDDDAKSTASSVATAVTDAAGRAATTTGELHRLIKLRQLYNVNRADDETGWLPSWHDDVNVWSDVVAGSPSGSRASGRAQSVASTATTSMGLTRGSIVGGVGSSVRWNKTTRKMLQHPAPDERVVWMDATCFAHKYNTLMLVRNLAQHPHHRLHIGYVDRSVSRTIAALAYPHYQLVVKKRPDAAAGPGHLEAWRDGIDADATAGQILERCGKDGELEKDFELGGNETDDEAGNSPNAASRDDDDVLSTSSSRAASSVHEGPGGSRHSSNSLVLRITVSQPVTTVPGAASPGLNASLRSLAMSTRGASGRFTVGPTPVVAGPPPPPLQVMVFRTAKPGKQTLTSSIGPDGQALNSLPMHSRVAARHLWTLPGLSGGWIESTYELEANSGSYNMVVLPAGDDAEDVLGMTFSRELSRQPFAVAVSAVKNQDSYDIATEAL